MTPIPSLRSAGCFTALLATTVATACDETPVQQAEETLDIDCSVPLFEVHRGARRGAIPALIAPELAYFGDPGTDYLRPADRVVGLRFDDQWIAIPHNIFWWHEVVNLDGDSVDIAVTHCPLTGSSLAFDRAPAGGSPFDVSGLLYQNNLMMVDLVAGPESLWPQMARGARCGPRDGTELPMVPIIEMTWAGWSALHPSTKVVTANTGFSRDYREYPYAAAVDADQDYDALDNAYTLFPVTAGIDPRRPPKERALGVPDGDVAKVFPYGELESLGVFGAVTDTTTSGPFVVLWSTAAQGAMAYSTEVAGQRLTFRVSANQIIDAETGSTWRVDGRAVEGPLAGETLEPVVDAFVAFWFSWPTFFEAIDLWEAP